MADKLLPVCRTEVAVRVGFIGVFCLAGLAAVIWGGLTAHASGGMFAFFGVLVMGAFVPVLVTSCRTFGTPGMLLTPKGFEFSGFKIAWSDVERFKLVDGEAGITHIKVLFKSNAKLSSWSRLSAMLGRCGLYTAPACIPIGEFLCEDGSLYDVLTNWWRTYRKPADR